MAKDCSLNAEGKYVYLDEYDTREEAIQALTDIVLQYADFSISEEDK